MSDQVAAKNHDFDNQAERLIPLSNGRFAMWLFLSTEVMFFAGCFAAVIVLRYSIPNALWPDNQDVHVDFRLGLINTVILTLSSVTALLAVRMASRNQFGKCRLAIATTLMLGVLFLGIKGYEYWTKYQLGIYPVPRQRQIFDQADIYYLAAVRNQVDRQIELLEKQKLNSKQVDLDERLENLYQVRSGLVLWTEQQLAITSDVSEQQKCLDMFAAHIYSTHNLDKELLNQFESNQTQTLSAEFSRIQSEYNQLNSELTAINDKLNELQAERREIEQRPDPKTDKDKADLKAVTIKISEAQSESGEKTQVVSAARQKLIPIENRLEFLKDATVDGGINHSSHNFRLPLVIPGGGTWMNCYYLLTGLHAVHVIAGLLVFALFLVWPFSGATNCTAALHNAVLYWHFVDIVWLVVFVTIYF